MPYMIGLDVGTSGAKALLINERGVVLASATHTYPLSAPKPLWSEQDPEDWWRASCQSISEVVSESGVDNKEVAGIGLTGQMHGLVLLDKNGEVLRPAILWNDQRTAEECKLITETIGFDTLLEITGNPVLPGFTAPKILWVKRHEPEIYEQIAHILLPKDYVRYRLTGEFAIDVADASGTSLLNVEQRDWSSEMLHALDIPDEWLPDVYESVEVTSEINKKRGGQSGLSPGTSVVAGAGDQAAGGVGSGTVSEGIVSVVLGTSGVVFAHTDQLSVEPEGKLHAFCHAVPEAWHVMGVTLSAAGSLRWFHDTLGIEEQNVGAETGKDSYELLTQEAAKISPGSEGLVFLPYLTGERTPYPDPDARGVFYGLTSRHTKAHMTRAVMEGVGFSLLDCLELIRDLGITASQIRISGGGAKSDLWKQILADIFQTELVTLSTTEGAPFGAALLAGVGTSVYENVREACDAAISISSLTHPNGKINKIYRDYYQIYRELYPSLKDKFKETSNLVNKYEEFN